MNQDLCDLRQAVITRELRKCSLFANYPAATLEEVARFTTPRFVAKGECLLFPGAAVSHLYVVQQGALNLHCVGPAGRERVLHVFRPPESYGVEALGATSSSLGWVCATEPTQLLGVAVAPFVALIRREPELALSVLQEAGGQMARLTDLLQDLTSTDLRTRLAQWLLDHCPDPESAAPHTFALPESKRLLAAELGVCGETLSRTLARLRQEHLLATRGRTITLLCPSELSRTVDNPRVASVSATRVGNGARRGGLCVKAGFGRAAAWANGATARV